MKRAVLIFGTFNPVTNAHLELGKEIKKRFSDVDIIYVLSNSNFMSKWKNMDNFLSDAERINLLKNAIKPFGFYISTIEVDGIVDSRTINTVSYYKKLYDDIFICFGMDKMFEIDKWYCADELISNNKFIIFTRDNKDLSSVESKLIKENIQNFEQINLSDTYQLISSTNIRNAVKNKNLEDYLKDIPQNVYQYLKEKNDVI